MSAHPLPLPLPLPLAGRYTAGMPQLCYNGLSENWLLKECGHRHWLAVAHSQGQQQPEFRDAQGHKVYAAFTLVRISQAQLELVEENDTFAISTLCHPAGRTQHYSQHDVLVRGQRVARVEMLSVFVRRAQAGSNSSIVRAVMSTPHAASVQPELTAAAEAFVRHGRERRAGAWEDVAEARETAAHETIFTPCPHNDFNGADLLYFSTFQALVDRAEWAWMLNASAAGRPARLLERELVFYGNLDLGDSVRTGLWVHAAHNGQLAHYSELRRGSDGMRIAEVFTRKEAAHQEAGTPAWVLAA